MKNFSELSKPVQNFLVDASGPEWAKRAEAEFGLNEKQSSLLLDIAERLVLEPDLFKILTSTILSELEVDWKTARQLAINLAGHRLLPIVAFLATDVAKYIGEWGGNPSDFKAVARVEVEPKDPAEVVEEILEEMEMELSDSVEQSRLNFILTSFVNGQRTKDDTLAALLRPTKVGGLNMPEAEAKVFLERFVAKAAPFVFKPKKIEPEKNIEKKPEVKPMIVDVKPPPTLKDSEPSRRASPSLTPPQPPPPKKTEDRGKDFATALDARLKGLRDAFETRDYLERPVEQGGLGITGSQLAEAMAEIEKKFAEQQTTEKAKLEKEKQILRENKAVAKLEAEKLAAEKAKAARPKPPPPKPLPAVVSPASPLPSGDLRPVLADVVAPAGRHLSGPIEELKNLTLEQFRRLSSDPKEAAIKIHDKINLLEEQGVGQKIAAVKAWRGSPVNVLYLEMSRAALLSGRMIDDISAERATNGELSLSKEEIRAINSLNGELRF